MSIITENVDVETKSFTANAWNSIKEFKDKYTTKDILYKIQRREVKDLERVQDTLLRTIEVLKVNELYHHDS